MPIPAGQLCSVTPPTVPGSSKPPQLQQSILGLKLQELNVFFSSSGCNTLRLFCSNKSAAQKSGSSEPASLLIKTFDDDLCSAEDVLRSPALLVHWCLSKGFYNNVGTVHGSCVNYSRGSNCLQQSVSASFSAEVWVECLTLCRCFRPAITCTMSASLFIWQSVHANFRGGGTCSRICTRSQSVRYTLCTTL